MRFVRTCIAASVCASSLTLGPSAFAEDAPKPPPQTLERAKTASDSRATPSSSAGAKARIPSRKRRFLGLRLPAFIAFGVGGLGAGGALVTGILYNVEQAQPAPNCNSGCDDSHATPSEPLKVASGVLAGVAAVGVGVGVGLMFTAPERSERSTLTPRLRLGVTREKASASAIWRF